MKYQPPKPSFLGIKILDSIDLIPIIKYIDWTLFFHTWKITGRYSGMEALCDCPSCKIGWLLQFPEKEREKAEEALKLFQDAQEMLQNYIPNKKLQGKALIYFSKARSENEGILVSLENEDSLYLPLLRQQQPNEKTRFCYSLADFISPEQDFIGAFAVSIHGAEDAAREFQSQGDDYNALLVKSLADRLVEATSEWLHEQVRKQYWGYAPQENFRIEELRKVPYQGIRPAIGYPSLPDQSLLFELNKLIRLEQIGISLTENGTMFPNASICGLYFSHPEAFYFMIGEIGKDQFMDYAERKNCSPESLRKWLAKVIDE